MEAGDLYPGQIMVLKNGDDYKDIYSIKKVLIFDEEMYLIVLSFIEEVKLLPSVAGILGLSIEKLLSMLLERTRRKLSESLDHKEMQKIDRQIKEYVKIGLSAVEQNQQGQAGYIILKCRINKDGKGVIDSVKDTEEIKRVTDEWSRISNLGLN